MKLRHILVVFGIAFTAENAYRIFRYVGWAADNSSATAALGFLVSTICYIACLAGGLEI